PHSRSLPDPPITTLFPYTTLFRSMGKPIHLARSVPVDVLISEGFEPPRGPCAQVSLVVIAIGDDGQVGAQPGFVSSVSIEVGQGDRKSTRLNSSHDQISYAVFCLK